MDYSAKTSQFSGGLTVRWRVTAALFVCLLSYDVQRYTDDTFILDLEQLLNVLIL